MTDIAYSLGLKFQCPGPFLLPIPTALRKGCSTDTRGHSRSVFFRKFAGRAGFTAYLLHLRTVVSTGETLTNFFHMVHALLSCSQRTMKYKAFKHPWMCTRCRDTYQYVYLFFRNIAWGRYDDTIEHWIVDMAVPALTSTFHRGQTCVQRNSLGFDNPALINSAIGDIWSPGML